MAAGLDKNGFNMATIEVYTGFSVRVRVRVPIRVRIRVKIRIWLISRTRVRLMTQLKSRRQMSTHMFYFLLFGLG